MNLNNKKIKNLTIYITSFAIGVGVSSLAFASYNLVNDFKEVSELEFEKINETSNLNDDGLVFARTRYQDIINVDDNMQVIDNHYSGMALSNEYEDFIRNLCYKYSSLYNLDYDALFKSALVIGDQESDGKWDCNGIISDTDDYGEFQINVSNHERIKEKFGYTPEELKNDKKKNAEAAIWIMAENMQSKYCSTEEDIYGMYNGWINWKEKKESVKYVQECLAREDIYFKEVKYLTMK